MSRFVRRARKLFVAIAIGTVSLSCYEQWRSWRNYSTLMQSTANTIQWQSFAHTNETWANQTHGLYNGSSESPRDHPHAGARFPDGRWGYIVDATAVRKNMFLKSRADGVVLSQSYLPLTPEEMNSVCDTPPGSGFEGPGWDILASRIQLDQQSNRSAASVPPFVSKGRIMCVVYTHAGAYKRLVGIRDTWAWRCDGFFAASTVTVMDPRDSLHFGSVDLPHEGPEEYRNMWQKTRSILGYLHDNFMEDYDYFYMSGDDTLLIVENLRRYLGRLESEQGYGNTSKPLYVGHPMFAPGNKLMFAGGGSGYLINRVALRMIVQELHLCLVHAHRAAEDRFLGKCMEGAGIPLVPAIDASGRGLFHGLDPGGIARDSGRRQDMDFFKSKQGGNYRYGADSVSSRSVSLHLLKTTERMKRMHAILFRSCPTGTAVGDALVFQQGQGRSLENQIENSANVSSHVVQAQVSPHQWIEDPEFEFPSQVCCGTDPPTFHHHPKECGLNPMPTLLRKRGISFSGRTDYRVHVPQKNACGCRHYINGTEPKKYRWESPELPSWHAKEFCNLLGNRTLLLIGDSVMNQLAVTLMNAVFPQPCGKQISFGHSDTLLGIKFGYGGNRGLTWRAWIQEYDHPDLVLMGTGNHQVGAGMEDFQKYWNDLIYDMDKFLSEVNTNNNKNTSLVWVTQPGHGCSRQITPDFADKWNWTAYEAFGFSKFSYDQFVPRTNNLILPSLHERGLPYIDLHMLLQRTDGHVDSYIDQPHRWADCTHFCMPGPLDVFPSLVLQHLMNSS